MGREKKEEAGDEDKPRSIKSLLVESSWQCPLAGNEPVTAVWPGPVRSAGPRCFGPSPGLGKIFSASFVTLAALVSKKIVLRVLLPSRRCKLVSSLLKISIRDIPLHHSASLCGVSRRGRIRACPNQAVHRLETGSSPPRRRAVQLFQG